MTCPHYSARPQTTAAEIARHDACPRVPTPYSDHEALFFRGHRGHGDTPVNTGDPSNPVAGTDGDSRGHTGFHARTEPCEGSGS